MPKFTFWIMRALASAVLALTISVTSQATLAVAQPAPAPQRNDSGQALEDFLRDFTADWVRNDPDVARWSRYFTGVEQDRLDRQITPRTLAQRQSRMQRAKDGLAKLSSFDHVAMTDTQRISADVVQWQLKSIIEEEPFLDHSFPLNHFNGENANLVLLTVFHPFVTERDAENYVAALDQVATRLREATAEAQRIAGKGILPPRFILSATVEQMQRFVATPSVQNPFVATLAQKMPVGLPEAKRSQLLAQAEEIVQADIYPAWREAIMLLESQVPLATDDAGLWRLPNGAEAYAYFLRVRAATDMTPDQIYELGLRQVDAIQVQMDQVLRRLGRTEGSVKDRLAKLRQDLAYPDPMSEESRAQILRDVEAILKDAQARAALLFDKTPATPIIVQPHPDFLEASVQASYAPPAPDGSRPGTLFYSRRPQMMTKFGLHTVIYHESIPGHHFQIALQVENKDIPVFRRLGIFGGGGGPIEGWALYAEHLAAETGWYDNNLEGLLGQLFWEELRARRLVVDTGLHAKRWTRQQAIDYGFDPAEVDRYIMMPGQASSYMVGLLKILEVREKARRALGDKFRLRDFHNMILSTGPVPLEVLDRETDAFIARMSAG